MATFLEKVKRRDPGILGGFAILIVGIILVVVGALTKVPVLTKENRKQRERARARRNLFLGLGGLVSVVGLVSIGYIGLFVAE